MTVIELSEWHSFGADIKEQMIGWQIQRDNVRYLFSTNIFKEYAQFLIEIHVFFYSTVKFFMESFKISINRSQKLKFPHS